MFLDSALISGNKVESRMNHVRVGPILRRLFWGNFIPQELKKAKVCEFITLKKDSQNVHEYGLKFIQLSRYASEMVNDMGSRMSLFVVGLIVYQEKRAGHRC